MVVEKLYFTKSLLLLSYSVLVSVRPIGGTVTNEVMFMVINHKIMRLIFPDNSYLKIHISLSDKLYLSISVQAREHELTLSLYLQYL